MPAPAMTWCVPAWATMDAGPHVKVLTDAARAVIVLAPESKDPDAHVIKAMLALTRRQGGQGCPIVAEIRSPRTAMKSRPRRRP